MDSLAQVSTVEFRQALTRSTIRTSQVIHLALAAGAFSFACVVLFLYFKGANDNAPDYFIANATSAIHVVFLVAALTLGPWISQKQFSGENLSSAFKRVFADKDGKPLVLTPAEKCVTLIRTASIIQLAMFEGAVFFGLTSSIIAVQNGVAQANPIYLLNMASAALFIAYVAVTFPNEERLEATFEKYFHRQRNP